MIYKLFVEGQQIELSEEVAATDETLRNTIVSFFPQMAMSEINRQQKEDGSVEIHLVKKAGTKGNCVLKTLTSLPSSINPALELNWQLSQIERQSPLTIEQLMSVQNQISSAIEVGDRWHQAVEKTISNLQKCQPRPSSHQIIGI